MCELHQSSQDTLHNRTLELFVQGRNKMWLTLDFNSVSFWNCMESNEPLFIQIISLRHGTRPKNVVFYDPALNVLFLSRNLLLKSDRKMTWTQQCDDQYNNNTINNSLWQKHFILGFCSMTRHLFASLLRQVSVFKGPVYSGRPGLSLVWLAGGRRLVA